MQKIILNSRGEVVTSLRDAEGNPVILNQRESASALMLQRKFCEEIQNTLGFEVNITTLYAISKRVVSQKFFEIPPADYMPIRVGENAWADNILTYRDYAIAGDFETGNINTASSNSRLAEADAGIDSVSNPVINWAKQISWAFPELKMAARSGNWDLVAAKEKSRKVNWDLGIQRIAFLGSSVNPNVLGLFTQPDVNANTTLITTYISGMNATQYSTLVAGLIADYRANSNYTSWPTHFTIPEGDFNGLGTLVPGTAGTYPVSMLDYLKKAFSDILGYPLIIQRNAYADKANNASVAGLNKNIYALYNYNEDSMRMDIPVDYTNTLQNTINGFQFQNVGYGQYTGLKAYRPLEMRYYTWG